MSRIATSAGGARLGAGLVLLALWLQLLAPAAALLAGGVTSRALAAPELAILAPICGHGALAADDRGTPLPAACRARCDLCGRLAAAPPLPSPPAPEPHRLTWRRIVWALPPPLPPHRPGERPGTARGPPLSS